MPTPASISGSTGVVRGEEAASSDSGIVDLKAIASADPSGSQRAQSTPLASSGLFEDESAPPKPSVSPATAERLASTPPPASSSAASAVAQGGSAVAALKEPAKKTAEKKSGGGGVVIVIGALVAAGAIAAGVTMFVKFQHNKAAMASMVAAPNATTVAAADKTKTQTQTTPTASVAQADDTQELPDTIDTSQPGKPIHHYRARTGGGAAPTTTTADPVSTGVDPKLIANVPTGPAGGGNGDLAEAMKTAAGGGTGLGGGGGGGGQTQAAAGNVAQRPSQGQVAGAIGSVMQAAKACLGADEPMSRATVTFQSDGSVKSVNVTGFAAGKPQEACIKGALSKAKVDPFAEASYPVPVSIRSN